MNLPELDSETGTWAFRLILIGLAFLLGLDVREAKKNLAAVPGLVKGGENLEKAIDKLEARVRDLEQKR